ncbi:MAG TPA: porin family protein [Puia sp.]|nr:porin family protein [Puia sp.]
MKKLLFLSSSVFLLTIAQAQVKLGIKGGVNISSITGNTYGSTSTLAGVNAGILASFPLFGHFSLQPELVYSAQGAETSDLTVAATLNTTYYNIPVLFKYTHPTGIFVETGPQMGFLTKANLKFDNYTENEKPNYRSADYAWAFGCGYQLKAIDLGIDARYNMGLTNFFEENYDGQAKNNVFQIGLYYLFGFKSSPAPTP